jgi:hypothetical protein
MLEGDIGSGVDRLANQEPGAVISEHFGERTFALLDRLAPQVLTVEFQKIEGVKLG